MRVRAYDGALVLRRWRDARDERTNMRQASVTRGGHLEREAPLSPARLERTVAQARGVREFENAPVVVRMTEDSGVVVSSAGIRLNRIDATALTFAAGATALTIAAPVSTWPQRFPGVRRLTLDAHCDMSALGDVFPSLRELRIGDGVERVDLAALGSLGHLTSLDLSHTTVAHLEALSAFPGLRALRLAHLRDLHSIEVIANVPLVALAIEQQPQLERIDVLRRCVTLEQLELLGLWQYTIEEMAWLHELPALVRAAIDIGGRRKNVELYQRARWAYPWPIFSDARVSSVASPERSA